MNFEFLVFSYVVESATPTTISINTHELHSEYLGLSFDSLKTQHSKLNTHRRYSDAS